MDPYQTPDTQDSAVVEAMAKRLEERGNNSKFNSFIDEYIERIDLSRTHRVLDLGCGTGVVTRRLRTKLPSEVTVAGADISQKLLDIARERDDEGIQWELLTEGELNFEPNSFDVVILHTVLTHVPDPVELLKEVKRVLTQNGICIIFDADYASTTYGISNFEEGRRIDLALLGAVVHNLDVCRRMPKIIKEAGLNLESHKGYIISEAGKGDFWLSSVRGFESLIPALNILPKEKGDAWVDEMLESHEEGTFFAAGNYYTYIATL